MSGEDEYVTELQHDRATAIWLVKLDDGSVIAMDDGRPGENPSSAWIRLGKFVREYNRRIVKLWLKFRSNVVQDLPENAEGYYFSKSLISTITSNESYSFYVLGYISNGAIQTYRYSVPDCFLVKQEPRELVPSDNLIVNPVGDADGYSSENRRDR